MVSSLRKREIQTKVSAVEWHVDSNDIGFDLRGRFPSKLFHFHRNDSENIHTINETIASGGSEFSSRISGMQVPPIEPKESVSGGFDFRELNIISASSEFASKAHRAQRIRFSLFFLMGDYHAIVFDALFKQGA